MMDFPASIEFHVKDYVNNIIEWLQQHFGWLFDFITIVLIHLMNGITEVLTWLPWWFFIIIIFSLGWRFRSLFAGILYALFLFIIGLFGYWDLMMLTLAIVLASVFVSLVMGIPIGIIMTYSRKLESFMKPILDAMQTMPPFVYLIPAILFFSLGKVPALFATVIYAIAPVIRLTNLAIRNVPKEVVEAGESFGSSKWQLLKKVQIPQALPTIMAGVNQTTMMALAMVVISSMVGAKGLGMEVLISINRINAGRGFESGISIVFLAIIIDRLTLAVSQNTRNK
ncbi:ABC transporter permease [Tuberibacillus sp. Marseille-P3662]|uniref:ABC transporter permease n=1 Tax=Tuberibacillus sp. Marseille-P3662 TaxID=1965358 RepID=UPI000A1CAB4D|nr:proline/glycine betaine ABC transporter permease [Tuberibacillus sp. Marseille-P3662]